MSKSENFSGRPIISQMLKWIPNTIISMTAQIFNIDITSALTYGH